MGKIIFVGSPVAAVAIEVRKVETILDFVRQDLHTTLPDGGDSWRIVLAIRARDEASYPLETALLNGLRHPGSDRWYPTYVGAGDPTHLSSELLLALNLKAADDSTAQTANGDLRRALASAGPMVIRSATAVVHVVAPGEHLLPLLTSLRAVSRQGNTEPPSSFGAYDLAIAKLEGEPFAAGTAVRRVDCYLRGNVAPAPPPALAVASPS